MLMVVIVVSMVRFSWDKYDRRLKRRRNGNNLVGYCSFCVWTRGSARV